MKLFCYYIHIFTYQTLVCEPQEAVTLLEGCIYSTVLKILFYVMHVTEKGRVIFSSSLQNYRLVQGSTEQQLQQQRMGGWMGFYNLGNGCRLLNKSKRLIPLNSTYIREIKKKNRNLDHVLHAHNSSIIYSNITILNLSNL